MVINRVSIAGVMDTDYFCIWTADVRHKTPRFYRVFTVLW